MNPASFIKIYFDYDEAQNKSKCNISNCAVFLSGKHTSNLEKHILRKHPIEAEIVKKKRSQLRQDDPFNSSNNTSPSGSGEYSRATLRKRKRKVEETVLIAMDRKKLMQACVELVTVNAHPFTLIEDSGFRQIIDPIINSLNETGPNFYINQDNITQEIHLQADNIRTEITRDLKNRLLSIKIDMATGMNRSLMAINAQYIKDGELIVRNLCVKELFVKHSVKNLKNEIFSELQKFDIHVNQLYSITTDNVANTIQNVDLLDKEVKLENGSFLETSGDDEWLEFEKEYEWAESTFENIHANFKEFGVFGQRCAAHTLQLAVNDVLSRDENTMSLLTAARSLCKTLRAPTILSLVTQMNKKEPVLDCPTRWHSSLDMIESLLCLRDICEDVMVHSKQRANLTDEQWFGLEELAKTLTPSQIATKCLQVEQQLLIGDFLQIWLRCKLETNAIGTALAKTLGEPMENREKKLFESPTIICALYLDPRWHIMLSFEQQDAAENYLVVLWYRLQNLQNNLHLEDNKLAMAEAFRAPQETVDPLDQLLQQRENAIALANLSPTTEDVRELIRNFKKSPRMPRSEDILQFWNQKSTTNPELYALSSVVLAAPATQVSVERVFSNLRYILHYLRSDLTSNLTSDILFVRFNNVFANKNKTSKLRLML